MEVYILFLSCSIYCTGTQQQQQKDKYMLTRRFICESLNLGTEIERFSHAYLKVSQLMF